MQPPAGFELESRYPRTSLFYRKDLADEIDRLGLHDPARWGSLVERGSGAAGRGRTALVRPGAGSPWILKQMRRGGLAGRFWRDRFPGTARLVANLAVPIEVARRGIATPAPVALLAVEGPRGLYRGWLATEEVDRARDLRSLLSSPTPPGEGAMRAVLTFVRRMHDVGIQHRDLNLGNLVARPSVAGDWEVFVVDLDRAALHSRPLGFRARQASLRRLERSYARWFRGSRPLGAGGSTIWYTEYAGADAQLARRFERGMPFGRALLALHRIGWGSPPAARGAAEE
jgi:hypothetical protein